MIVLRTATLADQPMLAHWDTQPHVQAASGDDEPSDWFEELACDAEWQENLIAELDGRPVGVIQIIDPAREESHYWGDVAPDLRAIDIWIGELDDLDRGYGTQMMRAAIRRCFAPPEVSAILIDPLTTNVDAHRFYQRLGFVELERRTFGSDDCLVHRLDRSTWDGSNQ